MTKAVFTTKVSPTYKDLPEERYHFPRTYLNYVRQTIGDYIVYYEPRRSSAELSSRGGRQSYFGVARVVSVIKTLTCRATISRLSIEPPIWTLIHLCRSNRAESITRVRSKR